MADLISELEHAVDGLFFPSESDEPLRVVVWPETLPFDPATLLQYSGHNPSTRIKTVDLRTFFRPALTEYDWHTQQEHAQTQRFQALVDLLESKLSDVQVYKIGSVSIDVYVIGQASDGSYLGITTRVVET